MQTKRQITFILQPRSFKSVMATAPDMRGNLQNSNTAKKGKNSIFAFCFSNKTREINETMKVYYTKIKLYFRNRNREDSE